MVKNIYKISKISLMVLLICGLAAVFPRVFAASSIPDEIETVDSVADGIIINLFDYTVEDSWGNNPSSISETGINTVSPYKFFGQGGNANENGGPNTFTGSNKVRQGILKNTLGNDGYPVLATGESLNVLFNENPISDIKKVYSNLNHFFKLNERGNYEYNSYSNYAYYDINQGNNGNFKVYNKTYLVDDVDASGESTEKVHVGLFPFNQYDEEKTNIGPADSLEEGINGYNHQFGFTMKTNFIYPRDGKNNGNDLIFKFSGDDDVWVFVDDVLVLDMGGLHLASSGSINFTTGEVIVEDATSVEGATDVIGTSNTINNIFSKLGKTFDSSYNSIHSIKFFYLERGGCYSDMSIETNLFKIEPEPVDNDEPNQIVIVPSTDKNSSLMIFGGIFLSIFLIALLVFIGDRIEK